VVVLGDLVLDVVARAQEPISSGSDVPATVRFRAGGSAANTARAVTRLGGRGTFVGAVGRDGIARRLIASLRADGVTVRRVTVEGPTARLVALIGPHGERSFLTERGAADSLRPSDLRAAWFRASALHLPFYSLLSSPLSESALEAARLARAAGSAVSVDLASSSPLGSLGREEVRRRLMAVAPDVIFGTEQEVAVVADAEADLLELAPLLVVKSGATGSRLLAESGGSVRRLEVATPALRVTDSTGAGDVFDAGFLLAWLPARARSGSDLRRAALAGHRAAAELLRGPRPELAI
jgi:sugar/nucleoside kinase (ribokinase family)